MNTLAYLGGLTVENVLFLTINVAIIGVIFWTVVGFVKRVLTKERNDK